MATKPPVSVELTLLHFEGLSPRSRNIGRALLCDRHFQLGMRAMTIVVKMLWGEWRERALHHGRCSIGYRWSSPMFAYLVRNLWDLSVVGPFIMGSVQMTKLTWSQRLQEILTTLSAQSHFP